MQLKKVMESDCIKLSDCIKYDPTVITFQSTHIVFIFKSYWIFLCIPGYFLALCVIVYFVIRRSGGPHCCVLAAHIVAFRICGESDIIGA